MTKTTPAAESRSKMEKSWTTIYKVSLLLLVVTLLIYIHDVIPQGYGKVGKSSLRVYLYTVFAELRYLIVLLFLYALSKGKQWRFIVLLPILLTTYQTIIRLFGWQRSAFNEFDVKLVITFVVTGILAFYYFNKSKSIKKL